MPDHSSDAAATADATLDDLGLSERDEPADPEAPRRRTRTGRTRRTDWRLGGRTVLRWREWLLAWSLVGLGFGLIGATLVSILLPTRPLLATIVLWIGMLVPIVMAFSRSRPIGLLRLRPADLLFGIVLGVLLRTAQGGIAQVTAGGAPLPSYPTVGGSLATDWWYSEGLSTVLIAPVIEEFFFRGVLLVALYTVLRRPFGKGIAGLTTMIATTGLFVVVHTISGSASVDQIITLSLVGVVTAALVLLTGRIWSAVILHVVFNATFVVLALIGTFLA